MQKFIDSNSDAKGKEVKLWMQKHYTDPWPDASIRQLNKMVRNLRNETKIEVFNRIIINQKNILSYSSAQTDL